MHILERKLEFYTVLMNPMQILSMEMIYVLIMNIPGRPIVCIMQRNMFVYLFVQLLPKFWFLGICKQNEKRIEQTCSVLLSIPKESSKMIQKVCSLISCFNTKLFCFGLVYL